MFSNEILNQQRFVRDRIGIVADEVAHLLQAVEMEGVLTAGRDDLLQV